MTDPTFKINRRIALQLMASAGIVASSKTLLANAEKGQTTTTKTPQSTSSSFGATGTRFNLEEAQRVMHELKVDALVLGDGRNFQQATGCLPVIAKMGWPTLNLAILVAKPEPKVLIVMLGFSYYYMAADLHTFPDNDVFLYGFGVTDDIKEQAALNSFRQFTPKATQTNADDALRRIRTIKSPIEIELMRASSAINVASAKAAVQQIGTGASHKDLRRAYNSELSKRDARSVFMVIDHVTDEQFDADLIDGQAFVIDCVCDHLGYLGDYGRTVFIGEPHKASRKAQITVGKAWDLLRSKLKPGLKFSEIEALGQQAMREQGTTYRVPFKPHSVGVFHSDHYGNGSSAPREDIVLRPGMIISIDCPVLEAGIGGSVHLEDLMLITEDGAEPLHDLGQQAIYI